MATFRKRRRGGCMLQNAAVPAALLGLEYMWRRKSLGRSARKSRRASHKNSPYYKRKARR